MASLPRPQGLLQPAFTAAQQAWPSCPVRPTSPGLALGADTCLCWSTVRHTSPVLALGADTSKGSRLLLVQLHPGPKQNKTPSSEMGLEGGGLQASPLETGGVSGDTS